MDQKDSCAFRLRKLNGCTFYIKYSKLPTSLGLTKLSSFCPIKTSVPAWTQKTIPRAKSCEVRATKTDFRYFLRPRSSWHEAFNFSLLLPQSLMMSFWKH